MVGVVLVVWFAVAVSAVDADRPHFRPRVLTTLSGPVVDVALDGTRAVAVLQSYGSPTFRLDLIDFSNGRRATTTPMAARARASLLALAGTTVNGCSTVAPGSPVGQKTPNEGGTLPRDHGERLGCRVRQRLEEPFALTSARDRLSAGGSVEDAAGELRRVP